MANEGGYEGIGPEDGIFIPAGIAFEYALERCLKGTREEKEEFREMLEEWYYSGNWIKRSGERNHGL